MKILSITITNFRGISDATTVSFNDFCCIVGKNDAGKSTILKALDLFLNESAIRKEDKNIHTQNDIITIELVFETPKTPIIVDDAIETTFKEEKLVDRDGYIRIKKEWDTSVGKIKSKTFIYRGKYDAFDIFKSTEKELTKKCSELGIETKKGNGETYNNKEKRVKIEQHLIANGHVLEYVFDELPSTGQTRAKKLLDVLRTLMPSFEYFKADSSLSDSDTSVQKYFKDKAFDLLKTQIDTTDVEQKIRKELETPLSTITKKINSVLSAEEKIKANVVFDWSKLISTSFNCAKDVSEIPLSQRGDGFRRITMLSYFEMLSEERNVNCNVIYGFEEPETFLHPETQKKLFDSLKELSSKGCQVFITTHSPYLISESNSNDVVYVTKENGYHIFQGDKVSVKDIIEQLGISVDDKIISLFYSDFKLALLVEGPDDVEAYSYISKLYKEHNVIKQSLEEMGVVIIPIGGCGAIKTWKQYDVIKSLGKPFFVLLDSDKLSADDVSKHINELSNMGIAENQYHLTAKRELENYIPYSYIHSIDNDFPEYGDWGDVKKLCKQSKKQERLGGKKVCSFHFKRLTFEQIRESMQSNGKDEFAEIINSINKIISGTNI